jgi:hypothetical protein
VRRKEPDLALLEDVVSDRILGAMRAAAAELSKMGVRHWLVGALAVGAHGHPRATKDVDFLVGDEAFETNAGGLVSMKPGLPIQANGVVVDHLSARDDEVFLRDALPPASEVLTVAPIEVVIYLKLKSPRAKDRADVVELIKAGADVERCRAWLEKHAAELVAPLEEMQRAALAEE